MNTNPGENKEWIFLGGAAVGAVVALVAGPHALAVAAAGSVLGLVFAPKAGRETRIEISEWARRAVVQARNLAGTSTNWEYEDVLPQPVEQEPNGDRPEISG